MIAYVDISDMSVADDINLNSNNHCVATPLRRCLRLVHFHRSAGACRTSADHLEVEDGTHSKAPIIMAVCGGLEVNLRQATPRCRFDGLTNSPNFSVTATSIVRLAYIVTINYHDDFSFHSVPSTFLAVLEPPTTILCVCLPMVYSLLARVRNGGRAGTGYTPYAYGGASNTHTYGSSFARRVDASKRRTFNPLETNQPDPFELREMNNTQREVKVSADTSGKGHRVTNSGVKSIDGDAESSSGSEAALVDAVENTGHPQHHAGGIMVSKNFTVSVTQRE